MGKPTMWHLGLAKIAQSDQCLRCWHIKSLSLAIQKVHCCDWSGARADLISRLIGIIAVLNCHTVGLLLYGSFVLGKPATCLSSYVVMTLNSRKTSSETN